MKFKKQYDLDSDGKSLPTRGAWIEIVADMQAAGLNPSLPTRGAWIEIRCLPIILWVSFVAPHTGSVD